MGNEIRERFKERKYSYRNKIKKENQNEKEKTIKIILFSPLIFLGFIGKIIDNNKIILKNKKEINKENTQNSNATKEIINKKNTQYKINNYQSFNKNININKNNNNNINELEEKIFIQLMKKINYLKNECEIIESEEYIINKYKKDNEIYLKAKEINKRINELLNKLNEINKEYKIIKDNNIILNPLYLNDNILIEDIITYRNLLEERQYKKINNKLKLLNDYNYLYKNVDKLMKKTMDIKEKSDRRVEELEERDEKYKIAKKKIINLSEIESCCNLIISKNTKYLEELENKVNKIDKKTYIEKKLKGMNGYLSSTLRYLALLTLTPLRGILPGIAARTVATRKLLYEMRKNMYYEKKEKIIYSIENYTSEINNKIYDIDNISDNIDKSLTDIKLLKKEFQDYFSVYNLKEYENAYKKLLILEKNILNNKEKINIMKEKLIKNKKINNENLTKVRKLNKN